MPEKPCWSCKGQGTGSWCALCVSPAELDCFGAPIEEGRRGTWVQTYSGRKFWPLSPRPEDIAIEDIAIGLARENRYGKQTLRPYKVAEHSVIVSLLIEQMCGREMAREALLHDCDEGYLPDMPRPMKYEQAMSLGPFRECGKLIQAAAFERFHVVQTEESHRMIDIIDKRLVLDEVQRFMRCPELYLERHAKLVPIGCHIEGLDEPEALTLFLSRFADLFPEELTP